MTDDNDINAEVVSVFPNKVRIAVNDLFSFEIAGQSLRVGSFLKISDNDNVSLICIIESFSIEMRAKGDDHQRVYMIDAYPLGTLKGNTFRRGGDELAIPPKKVVPATRAEIAAIYANAFLQEQRLCFSSLTRQRDVKVPVYGDRFFNKHIAVVGASGSGKSSSVARILQEATAAKSDGYTGLNNSHIVIFDIHGEYASAFPSAKLLSADDIVLPYWLLNDGEMSDMFLESGDSNNYNQEALLRSIITHCKEMANPGVAKVNFDSPLKYDMTHLQTCFMNLSRETKDANDPLTIKTKDGNSVTYADDRARLTAYSNNVIDFALKVQGKINNGPYADGTIDKFVRRISAKVNNARLGFMFGSTALEATLEDVIRQITGYEKTSSANVTIIDLSGIPFEVLSITVSLVTRLLFDFSYHARRQTGKCETPFLLVYEEAHKYAPRSDLARFKASLSSIERIAKEGRKYGVSLMISSQRPSEISETIFSQCSNFLAMRLTNPDDQAYVKRLLPDTLGNLTAGLPALEQGEALLIGDAVAMPCVVYVNECSPRPSSNDIRYYEIWKNPWHAAGVSDDFDHWLK
ncbi:DUF87 domain-containing protein [Sphingomonas sp. CFBP 13603]|uniref:helicase HerA domain-containing protein n=1 Tax=Sphingomonas sp. CFBP 13603 TaxID=2774040 RepID=UPI00186675EE|nr:DUF87 domain-containing protein [Sphingomonas sp. CFBP 13603]